VSAEVLSLPQISAELNLVPRKLRKNFPSVSLSPGYSLKELENCGEFAGPSSHYNSVMHTAEGPIVPNGLQNHNARIIKEKRIGENTDYVERTSIGREKLGKSLQLYDEPDKRRIYELPPGKWPKPGEPVRVLKKCDDNTFRPPSPLVEMTPFPDEDGFKSKIVKYIGDPYENTAQSSYLTGAKIYHGLNNAKYDRPIGRYAPEPYNQLSVKRKRDARDVYYVDTRKYIPGRDSMNPYTSATPYSRKPNPSVIPDTRQSIPASARQSFGNTRN
jgi:hypothetical protein